LSNSGVQEPLRLLRTIWRNLESRTDYLIPSVIFIDYGQQRFAEFLLNSHGSATNSPSRSMLPNRCTGLQVAISRLYRKSARPGNGNADAALTASRNLPLHTAGRLCSQPDRQDEGV
jgi:hypothetical protein